MNKILLSLIIFTLMNSCSSTKEKTFSDQVSPDLKNIFNLSDSKFEKFKVEKIKPSENDKKTIKKPKKNKLKKLVKTKEIKKQNEAKVQLSISNEKASDVEEKMENKEKILLNYLKEFINYDKKSKGVWDVFRSNFHAGEKFEISLKYLGVTAGYIKIETKEMVKLNNKDTYHFVARLKSADFYKYIYSLDDTVESFISKDNFLPVKYSLTQRESGQTVDDLQLFDSEKQKTFFWYKRLKKGKIKTRHIEAFIPKFFQDSFSSLFFVRGLPLNKGDLYEFPVMTRGKIWLIKMRSAGIEKINIMDKSISAIKVVAETHFPGVLKKKGDILFWYSADKSRRLLKFEAKVKIGTIKGELTNYYSPLR